MSTESFVLDVTGMTCASCVASVEKVTLRAGNVESVSVNLPLQRAVVNVTLDSTIETTKRNVIAAIERSGFQAKEHRGKTMMIENAQKKEENAA